MQINKEFLKSLRPCVGIYKRFLRHSGDFDGSFSEFLDLPNLDYDDKVWVAEKVLTKNQAVKWATLCAESVVHMFEEQCPGNKCLSNCIDFLKSVNDFNSLTDTERLGVESYAAAAYDAYDAAYSTVYDSSGAEYAALAARYAAHAALAAADHSAFYAAGAASTSTSAHATNFAIVYGDTYDGVKQQQALNIKFLKQVTGA